MNTQKNCKKFSDEELVQGSLENIEYFACLFERYEEKLIRYILRITSFTKEEAEDVLQEVFLKIWKNLNKFDNSSKFSSWAYRITHNTAISEWKKSKSFGKDRRIRLEDKLFENLASEIDVIKDIKQADDSLKINETLNNLPEKYKNVLVLKFLEGRNYNEISDILKKPPGTIASLIHRAKKMFKEEFCKKEIF